jgi:hypothetical protein
MMGWMKEEVNPEKKIRQHTKEIKVHYVSFSSLHTRSPHIGRLTLYRMTREHGVSAPETQNVTLLCSPGLICHD